MAVDEGVPPIAADFPRLVWVLASLATEQCDTIPVTMGSVLEAISADLGWSETTWGLELWEQLDSILFELGCTGPDPSEGDRSATTERQHS